MGTNTRRANIATNRRPVHLERSLGTGTIAVFVETGNPPINSGVIGDGGPARSAFLDGPDSVRVDSAGMPIDFQSSLGVVITP